MNNENVRTDNIREKMSTLRKTFVPKSEIEKYLNNRIKPYSKTAPCTKVMQAKTQVEIDVKDFVLGVLVVILMNRFTRTKNKVISKPILPGTTSGGMTKLI